MCLPVTVVIGGSFSFDLSCCIFSGSLLTFDVIGRVSFPSFTSISAGSFTSDFSGAEGLCTFNVLGRTTGIVGSSLSLHSLFPFFLPFVFFHLLTGSF